MIAKNNIFNIRKGLGAKWQGETGARKGFVEFETREYGIRAWIVLMHNYRVKHKCANRFDYLRSNGQLDRTERIFDKEVMRNLGKTLRMLGTELYDEDRRD